MKETINQAIFRFNHKTYGLSLEQLESNQFHHSNIFKKRKINTDEKDFSFFFK